MIMIIKGKPMKFTINGDIWYISEATNEQLLQLLDPDDTSKFIFGLTSRSQHHIYINQSICEGQKKRTLLHELMHCYLWEYGICTETFGEENMCDIFAGAYSVAKPIYEKYFKGR